MPLFGRSLQFLYFVMGGKSGLAGSRLSVCLSETPCNGWPGLLRKRQHVLLR